LETKEEEEEGGGVEGREEGQEQAE